MNRNQCIKRSYILAVEYEGSPPRGAKRLCTRPTPNKYDLMKDHWLVLNENLCFPEDLSTKSYVWNSESNEPNAVTSNHEIEVLKILIDELPYFRFSTYSEIKNHLVQDKKILSISEIYEL